jgi:hypothetical protein
MLSIKHQSRYFRRSVYRISFNQISLFQHPQLNSIALVITIIEINLDDQIAKKYIFQHH